MTDLEPLRPGDVVAVYEQVLGRAPSAEDLTHHLATSSSVAQMLRVALDSEEYAYLSNRPRPDPVAGPAAPPPAAPARVNIHHPDLAAYTHPVGTRDEDGVAIVGHDGWLFLRGGTNMNLPAFTGELVMEDGWLDGWAAALELRAREVAELGAELAVLVVPDKLAVYERHFPEPLVRQGPRPIERLLGAGLDILYPLAELQARADDTPVYLRTDTHVSLAGNQLLFETLAPMLQPAAPVDLGPVTTASYVSPGDLGARFQPQVIEVMTSVASLLDARIVTDNRAEMMAVGGHIGTHRVFRNEQAADPRTVVLFGDSFGFGDAAYQGLSWFMAQAYREVHFVWVPFGWDPVYTRAVEADLVVIQGAERFLGRVPSPAVDTAELAAETLRRKAGLDLEVAFEG